MGRPVIGALILALQTTPAIPLDWTQLPPIPWRTAPRYDPGMARFVVAEVATGRCVAAIRTDVATTLRVDMAVLISPDATVRAVTPRAIGCATVEQYAAGLVTRMARGNLTPAAADTDGWYRASITFTWRP